MNEVKDNLGYLGNIFQQKVLWQLLTNQKFAENIIPYLDSKYFDDGYFKRLIILIKNYQEKHERTPSIKNASIHEIINSVNIDQTEKDVLTAVVTKIESWEGDVIRGIIPFDGNIVQKQIYSFIKQQEYKSLGGFIDEKVRDGKTDDSFISEIEEKVKLISKIGVRDERAVDPFANIDSILDDDYREVIPTGIIKIDELMGGGLGKKELGLILAAPGTGKSTILTLIANTGINVKKNVLQIIFEDQYKDIIRKHYSIWSKTPLSDLNKNKVKVKASVIEVYERPNLGKLVIVRFPEEGVTVPALKRWILEYQVESGIVFDELILDYLDCLESDRRLKDKLEEEMRVIKSLIVMLDELNIPGWSAVQSNRSGVTADYISSNQVAGNFKKTHKVHFFMSVSKNAEQKLHGRANVEILKSRFGGDGFKFEDIIFNNNKMEIIITDKPQKYDPNDLDIVDDDMLTKNLSLIEGLNLLPEIKKVDEVKIITTSKSSDFDFEFDVTKIAESLV